MGKSQPLLETPHTLCSQRQVREQSLIQQVSQPAGHPMLADMTHRDKELRLFSSPGTAREAEAAGMCVYCCGLLCLWLGRSAMEGPQAGFKAAAWFLLSEETSSL